MQQTSSGGPAGRIVHRLGGAVPSLGREGVGVHTNFIAGIVAPHAKKAPEDEWARLALDQLGGVKATLEVLTRLERS